MGPRLTNRYPGGVLRRPARLLLAFALALVVLLGPALPGGGSAVRFATADDTKDALKAFRSGSKAEDWKLRREAYLLISDYDGAVAVQGVLSAMAREKNPAILLTAIGILAGFTSEGAQKELVAQLAKSKGGRKMYVLLALARQKGDKAVPILLETLRGKDAPAIAQAAIALGSKEVKAAIPDLVALLRHKDWQVRRAAAMGIARIAQPPPPKPKKGEQPDPKFRWPVPDELKTADVTTALTTALAAATGRDRGDLIAALETIHEKPYGHNVAAWRLVAQGKEPDERILRKTIKPAYVFGVPIWGSRVVLIYDNSLRSADPHNFGSGDRLMELCEVPGGRPLLHMRLRTTGQFVQAHFKRCIRDMGKGTKFELIYFNETVRQTFGKFASVGTSSRRRVDEMFSEIKNDNGIASYDALTTALDLGGAADSKAWKRGPDEIIFMSCNVPTVGELKEADVVGAAIALKARLRMVPIHTTGVLSHAFEMMRTIAEETGGVYRNYDK